MASITKRESARWQAKVRKLGGKNTSRTFATKAAAESWAKSEESDMERGVWRDRTAADRTTLSALLTRYFADVIEHRRSAPVEKYRIERLKEELGHYRLSSLSPIVLAEWRDTRLQAVSPSTVARELSTLGGALTWARKERMISLPENPVAAIRRPKLGEARNRRLEHDEEARILDASVDVPLTSKSTKRSGNYRRGARNPWFKSVIMLALETAMRQGELVSLRWEHVDLTKRTAHLPVTKNGKARDVPLSSTAINILTSLPRSIDGRVFPVSAEAVKRSWIRTVKRARERYCEECSKARKKIDQNLLVDLHFHDLRHEATSRLSLLLPNLIELASVTGHSDLRMLQRYYHPRASDLAKKLG